MMRIKMTTKQDIQWKEVALQLDALLRKLHEEIGTQIVKNTFVYGLVQEEPEDDGLTQDQRDYNNAGS